MIKPPHLPALVAALAASSEPERESAIARLILAGPIAVTKVAAFVRATDTPARGRIAGLRVLAPHGGPAAVDAAVAVLAFADQPTIEEACRLLGVAARGKGAESPRALDALAGLALDGKSPVEARLAAVAALDGLPRRLVGPIYEAIAQDSSSRMVSRVARLQRGVAGWSIDTLADGELPDSPSRIAAAVEDEANTATLTGLRRLVDAVRLRESSATGATRDQWRTVRGSVHDALAQRGSRIALYDLREAIEAADAPLPISFLAALSAIGDASCFEGLAAAWIASGTRDRWYRDHLVDVFAAIVKRTGITREDPTLLKILHRWPQSAPLVALAPRRASRRKLR